MDPHEQDPTIKAHMREDHFWLVDVNQQLIDGWNVEAVPFLQLELTAPHFALDNPISASYARDLAESSLEWLRARLNGDLAYAHQAEADGGIYSFWTFQQVTDDHQLQTLYVTEFRPAAAPEGGLHVSALITPDRPQLFELPEDVLAANDERKGILRRLGEAVHRLIK